MIAVGCDHGGVALKQKILAHLQERGLTYQDFGCGSTASVDYPVYGKAVARGGAGKRTCPAATPKSPRCTACCVRPVRLP